MPGGLAVIRAILKRGRPAGFLGAGGAVAAVLLLLLAPATLGHEGGPRLILEPPDVNPGGVVVVRGEDLPLDETMQVALVGGTGRADIGSVTSDGEGHFTLAVTVPADVPVGEYAVEAVGASGAPIRGVLRLVGSPILEVDGAPPGQDEGLPALRPMASGATVAAPVSPAAPVASPPAPTTTATGLTPMSEQDLVPIAALGLAVAGLVLLVWRNRGSPATPAGSADMS
jgi:hypothetical protein